MTAESRTTAAAASAEFVALIPYMRAFARSLCRNPTQADDLTQNALASAWRHRCDFEPGTNLKAWVFRIVRNQFYSDCRHSRLVCEVDFDLAAESLVAVSDPSATLELDDVRRAMQELPDEQREALTLIGVAGLAYDEVAAICGCAEDTVKSRVSRARLRLLAILSDGAPLARRRTHPRGGVMASMLAEAEQLPRAAADRDRRAAPA